MESEPVEAPPPVGVPTAANLEAAQARRNYRLFILEGGFFVGGLAFVAAETVLPTIVKSLGGPTGLIAFLPTLMFMGFSLPPLFTAHFIEQFDRMKPYTAVVGIFQRLPFLIAAIVLWFWGGQHPGLAVGFVVAAPFLSGFAGGMAVPAWMTLQVRTIRSRRRASANGLRNLFGAVLGIGAGVVVDWVLREMPGSRGYAILHLCAFGAMVLSLLTFLIIHEPPTRSSVIKSRRRMIDNLRGLPAILRRDHTFSLFLASNFTFLGLFIVVPFLAIEAQDITGRGPAFAGELVVAQMSGFAAGNILCAYIGDNWGGKTILLISRFAFIALLLIIFLLPTETGFYAAFAILGLVISSRGIGAPIFLMDHAPEDRTPTYLSLVAAINFLGMILAGGIGWTLRETLGGLYPLAAAALALIIISTICCLLLVEPRTRKPAES